MAIKHSEVRENFALVHVRTAHFSVFFDNWSVLIWRGILDHQLQKDWPESLFSIFTFFQTKETNFSFFYYLIFL